MARTRFHRGRSALAGRPSFVSRAELPARGVFCADGRSNRRPRAEFMRRPQTPNCNSSRSRQYISRAVDQQNAVMMAWSTSSLARRKA